MYPDAESETMLFACSCVAARSKQNVELCTGKTSHFLLHDAHLTFFLHLFSLNYGAGNKLKIKNKKGNIVNIYRDYLVIKLLLKI